MRKLIVTALCLLASSVSIAGHIVDTPQGERSFETLVEGDVFYDCQQDICKEMVVKKKTTLGKILKNSAKLAIPATALAMMATIPGADGGPISAAACGTVCWFISEMGCDAGTWVVMTANPGVGILYGLVCRSMIGTSTASCAAVCAALPSP